MNKANLRSSFKMEISALESSQTDEIRENGERSEHIDTMISTWRRALSFLDEPDPFPGLVEPEDPEDMDERIKRVLDKIEAKVHTATDYPFQRSDGYEMGLRDGLMEARYWLEEEFCYWFRVARRRIHERLSRKEGNHGETEKGAVSDLLQ